MCAEIKRIPIKDGVLTAPLTDLNEVRLSGSRCRTCGEVALGKASSCQNCAGEDMESIPLGQYGKLWTYTVIRNRPPGDYKGPDPYIPFGEGLVEMPEGIRVKTPLGVAPDKLEVGMELKFVAFPLYTNTDHNEVISFRFDPVEENK